MSHLVGFTIEIYYDARPCKRQKVNIYIYIYIEGRNEHEGSNSLYDISIYFNESVLILLQRMEYLVGFSTLKVTKSHSFAVKFPNEEPTLKYI